MQPPGNQSIIGSIMINITIDGKLEITESRHTKIRKFILIVLALALLCYFLINIIQNKELTTIQYYIFGLFPVLAILHIGITFLINPKKIRLGADRSIEVTYLRSSFTDRFNSSHAFPFRFGYFFIVCGNSRNYPVCSFFKFRDAQILGAKIEEFINESQDKANSVNQSAS